LASANTSDFQSARELVPLNFFAEILDVATEAFGRLATRANEGHESHGQEKKQELFQ
jgi:hypothetical protein